MRIQNKDKAKATSKSTVANKNLPPSKTKDIKAKWSSDKSSQQIQVSLTL